MVSRLISRIKHREFGVFVTTAFIGPQPYQEVREDGHPIIFLVGRDLVEILKRMGLTAPATLAAYLEEQHPVNQEAAAPADLLFDNPVSINVAARAMTKQGARPDNDAANPGTTG